MTWMQELERLQTKPRVLKLSGDIPRPWLVIRGATVHRFHTWEQALHYAVLFS